MGSKLKSLTRKDGKSYSLKDNKDRFFYPKEYGKFEDKLKPKQKHSVRVLLNTGARINEARNILVSDIDFTNNRIVLRITKSKAKKKERIGRTRVVPISTQFRRYLKRWVVDNKLKLSDKIGVLSTPALNIAMKKAAKESGIRDYYNLSPHNLRKTLEVWLMALGVDSLPLTAHIGHDIRTAAQYYVSPDIFTWEEKKLIREVIGDLYARR